jgi:hypothetical protein
VAIALAVFWTIFPLIFPPHSEYDANNLKPPEIKAVEAYVASF